MPENETRRNTTFLWSPNECYEYRIHVHTLPENGITQIMRHDNTLKWTHDGHEYCLHVQKDKNPVDPIEQTTLVDFVDWIQPDELDRPIIVNHTETLYSTYNETYTRGGRKFSREVPCQIGELEYWQNKLAETLDSDAIAKINTDSVSDCISALQDDFVILPFRLIQLSFGEKHDVSKILPIYLNDYLDSDPYFVTSDTSWCDPDYIHSWAIISKKNILETWPETDDWKKKGEEVMQSLITQHNLYRADSCWQYILLEKTCDGKWEKIEHATHFLGEDIIQSGMADHIGLGLLDAIASRTREYGHAETHIYYTYD